MSSKKPRLAKGIEPDPSKTPAVDPALKGNAWPHKPLWKVGRLDLDGKWSWRGIKADELEHVLERMRSFESMTWAEIERKSGKYGSQCHTMPSERICEEARARLTTLRLDELPELYSMRCDQKGRLWGYRIGHVLHVLWWDPNHTVYPVEKSS
ncbi:MAG: hypothetical protein IPJ77_11275 [Planctomycetes bacterium]|nr:hypothetical protein [Planctomycetota bacterium]